jgi:hypothetical protein
MWEKIKNIFRKKDKNVKISITLNDNTFEDVEPEDIDEIFKQISEALKKTSTKP